MKRMPKKNVQPNQIIDETVQYSTNWMECVEVSYQDAAGSMRSWDCVHRKPRSDAVVIVPRLVPSGRYILIKQFRPPVGTTILEFPAGLIDAGESPEQAAIRELKEETGYTGKVLEITPRLHTSPGMLSEACYYASLAIDEMLQDNQMPQAAPEPGEFIEVIVKAPQEVVAFIEDELQRGCAIDIKLYTFFGNFFFPHFPNSSSIPHKNL